MQFRFRRVDWEYASPYRIAYRTETHAETVHVEIEEAGLVGRGEALGVFYHDETADSLLQQLADVARDIRSGISRVELDRLLPAGGARNALDCALWDLEAKRAGRRAWELAGLSDVRPVLTDYTLGLNEPQETARAAAAAQHHPLLKLKLDGEDDLRRVALVREARPDAQLIVDANESWREAQLRELAPRLAELGVMLIEQPLPAGEDDLLASYDCNVPLCADESCQSIESLSALEGKYQYVNIKLDKTGGLTEALRLARAARDRGFRLSVGCMGGSSLSMAPAFVLGQLCELADLDGPLLLKGDMEHPIRYEASRMLAPSVQLWG
jgi:L-alanine-DL-glutamate epimerase-like enolase superfamily enzyme